MASCPHCSEAIESLPGFVAQAKLEERLKNQASAKDAEIQALSGEVTKLRTQASSFEAVVAERDGLRGELDGLKMQGERTAALSDAGLSSDLLAHVELLYNSATAGADEPPAFADWLSEAGKAHPLLAPHFAGEGAAPPPGTTPPVPPNLNPSDTGAAPPAPPGGKPTPQDVAAYFQSAEYAALNPEQKRGKIAELRGSVGA